ncbi:MAG: penicillin-binding protein 1C [Bacteroidales bacterium]|nr:penicillin-binding protein 1C [Bacteroidales bacterium]
MGRSSHAGKIMHRKRTALSLIVLIVAALCAFVFCLAQPLFNDPTSTVLEDRNGELLAARIAKDGQWRFPETEQVPAKFKKCIIAFEDQYFNYHPGVNLLSLFRAAWQNWQAGEIVSGGSTLTMQVIRLSRKGKSRTIKEKIIECILALRAEFSYNKKEILALYASHAPFGGNVVGLDAAAWRYYNRPPEQLSWGETAALAVLPNAPALIFPGTNNREFTKKRNRLLRKLHEAGTINSTTYSLAIAESLPGEPLPLPQEALHLLNRAIKEGHKGERIKTTIDRGLQKQAGQLVEQHHRQLKLNEIHNAAALILDVQSGDALAYVGNVSSTLKKHGEYVDVIDAPRSSGSILKPILYATMLMDGKILPKTLVADVPTQIAGYTPMNFSRDFNGAVHADEALYRSLNVPAVRMLKDYGLPRFYHKLQKLKLSTLKQPVDHYGLSIILGGSEVTLWEITGIYAGMARTLNHFYDFSSRYNVKDFRQPNFYFNQSKPPLKKGRQKTGILSAASIWHTFEAMKEVHRPREESGWQHFKSSKNIAWKTGTSFGFRDAWAIGLTTDYAIGVWAGNADGEGRPGLTGVTAAAPLLFRLFKLFPASGADFDVPFDEMKKAGICRLSGHLAGQDCPDVDTMFIPIAGQRTSGCPYHKLVHLDKDENFRVTSQCMDVYEMEHKSWFVLPPVMEWYYKQDHPEYRSLPPLAPGCRNSGDQHAMDIVYPRELTQVFIPTELNGQKGKVVFQVAHRDHQSTVYWHLDEQYVGKTQRDHQKALSPEPGKHTLTLVDKEGAMLERKFVVMRD